jgi:Fe-S-cluster-containing hydrogenase component 2
MTENSIMATGIPSPRELESCPGIPTEERMRKGRVAVIECVQEIPCNPCESACKAGAITVGEEITSLPALDGARCTGCGQCIPSCPGLAIFIVDKSRDDGKAVIEFPYECLPLPNEGDAVTAVNRGGEDVCPAKVLSVREKASYDGTRVISLLIPMECADEARGMKRLPRKDID